MAVLTQSEKNRLAMTYTGYDLKPDGSYTLNYTNGSSINTGSFVGYDENPHYVTPPQPSGKSMNTRTSSVQTKAGYLGQVWTNDPYSGAKVILWESSPKKTLAKADKAAQKAQLRAAQRSFE